MFGMQQPREAPQSARSSHTPAQSTRWHGTTRVSSCVPGPSLLRNSLCVMTAATQCCNASGGWHDIIRETAHRGGNVPPLCSAVGACSRTRACTQTSHASFHHVPIPTCPHCCPLSCACVLSFVPSYRQSPCHGWRRRQDRPVVGYRRDTVRFTAQKFTHTTGTRVFAGLPMDNKVRETVFGCWVLGWILSCFSFFFFARRGW